jgi:hypothetical protein
MSVRPDASTRSVGAHEGVHAASAVAPVDSAALRHAAPEIATAAEILRRERKAGRIGGEQPLDEREALFRAAQAKAEPSVLRRDRKALLNAIGPVSMPGSIRCSVTPWLSSPW